MTDLNGTKSLALVDNDGSIDITKIPDNKLPYYKKIAESLNEHDINSITTFGAALNERMNTYSNQFLKERLNSKSTGEIGTLITDLLKELKKVDVEDLKEQSPLEKFLSRIPILNKFITSVEEVKLKYDTIEANIGEISDKLAGARQMLMRDNSTLDEQFNTSYDYVTQLEDLCIAATLKLKELEDKIASSTNDFETSDLIAYKTELEKHVVDMSIMKQVFKQSLSQIRIVQGTNRTNMNVIQKQIILALQAWRNELAMAVALSHQEEALKASTLMSDATNELLIKNSTMIRDQSIKVAEIASKPIIKVETLQQTTENLIATISNVREISENASNNLISAKQKLSELEQKITNASTQAFNNTRFITEEIKAAKQLDLVEA